MNEDRITIRGLRAQATHGVLDFEKVEAQEFKVDIELVVNTDAAAATDDVAQTVNYAEVADKAMEVLTGPHVDLIETLAHRILAAIMDPQIIEATVTIHKPGAPINHPFDDVEVAVTRPGPLNRVGLRRYVIGIGSNIGAEERLREAVERMDAIGLLQDARLSDIYRTAPVLAEGQAPQDDYLNAVLITHSALSPLDMLSLLNQVEAEGGRVRLERWGARTLDLDIVDISGIKSDAAFLTVPHPRAKERRFVLEPWLSVDPDAELDGVPVRELLAELGDTQRVERYAPASAFMPGETPLGGEAPGPSALGLAGGLGTPAALGSAGASVSAGRPAPSAGDGPARPGL